MYLYIINPTRLPFNIILKAKTDATQKSIKGIYIWTTMSGVGMLKLMEMNV
jgi:hypothetical protein